MGGSLDGIIGDMHITVDREGQAIYFAKGRRCSISGQVILDAADQAKFEQLNFHRFEVKVGDWTATPDAKSLSAMFLLNDPTNDDVRRRCEKAKAKGPLKNARATFTAWKAIRNSSGAAAQGQPPQFASAFTIELPWEYAPTPPVWPLSLLPLHRRCIRGVEIAAEVHVARVGNPNDYAWRQNDKVVWVLPPIGDKPKPHVWSRVLRAARL